MGVLGSYYAAHLVELVVIWLS